MKKDHAIALPCLVGILIVATMALSCKKDHTSSLPILTTTPVTNITDSTASSGGTISSAGGSSVMGRGVNWDTASTFASIKSSSDGTGTGNFSSSLTGIFPATTYYVRAYAINSVGTGYGNIVKFTTSFISSKYTVTALAGTGATGSGDGNGNIATFSSPVGVCVDLAGNVYAADGGDNKIRKISPGGVVSTLAVTDGSPTDVAVDALGNVYVSETTFKILRITPAGTVTIFAGSGINSSVDGTGTAASFSDPLTLAIDVSGNLFVGDVSAFRKITPAGVVTTLPITGTQLVAIAVDKNKNLYISDGFIIKKVDTLGVMSFIAGGQGSSDGFGATAGFNSITELKTDQAGNIYAADARNNKIRLISPAGMVTTLAGTGLPGETDGNAGAATFKFPTGLAIDLSGNIYVADATGNKIRKISQ
jgi:hypothetical protein